MVQQTLVLMSQHIRLVRDRDWWVVEVDDHELFDFIDDFLTEETEAECVGISFDDPKLGTWNRAYFPGTDESHSILTDALARLDPAEIERIYRVNNPLRSGAT